MEFWQWRIRIGSYKEVACEAGIAISGFKMDADYSLVYRSTERSTPEYLEVLIWAAKAVGAGSVTIHSNALGEEELWWTTMITFPIR